MTNWETYLEVKLWLEFIHGDGKKEFINKSLIVEAENKEKAIEIIFHQYENSKFLKINEVIKIWKY